MKDVKNDIINLRISTEEKEQIQREAEILGMSLSAYLLYRCKHKQVVVIEGGKELAQEIYTLNQLLKKYEEYPLVPIQEIRNIVSESIVRISHKAEEADHGYIKI